MYYSNEKKRPLSTMNIKLTFYKELNANRQVLTSKYQTKL